MKLLRLAAWTLWFMLSWIAIAHAGPVAAALGALGSFLASGTLLANLALSAIFTAVKIGISLLTKAQQDNQQAGIQADIKVGGDNPLSFIMGRFATPGQLEYANTWGKVRDTHNAYITHVISLGDLPMGLTGLWFDDQKVTVPNMSGPPQMPQGWDIPEIESKGGNTYCWIRYLDGTQTSAEPFLVDQFGGDPQRPWLSDMIGLGVPMLIATARFNPEVVPGIPQYLMESNGIPLYDPRKDSSVGGSGTQRWNNPVTWQPSSNNVVHVYNILRGIHYEGERIWGGRCQAWQLPLANWMAGMNACDLTITNADGSQEPQFRNGCEITVDQEPATVIENIMKGANGRIAEIGGIYKVTVGAPGAAVFSFTDETIVVTEGQALDPFPGLESTYNGAQASYPEPAEKWGAKDAPAYLRTDLEALDDDRRLLTGLQFPYSPYARQIQRLLQAVVQDARRFRVHTLVLPPEAWLLEPNDVVSWTSARNGYEEKKFIVVEIEGDSNFLQYVTLKEVDPADYSWNPVTDEQDYSVGPIGPIKPGPQAMTGWQVFPATIERNGKQMPSIRVNFAGQMAGVQSVHVQARFAGTTDIVFDGFVPYGDPDTNPDPASVVLNGIFLPEEDYEVSGVFVPFPGSGVVFEPSAWLPVTTPNVWINDVYPIDLDRLAEDVRGYLEFVGGDLREALRRLQELDLWIADQDLGNAYDRQQLRTQITATFESARAEYTQEINVLAAADLALASRIETLDAEVFDPETGLPAVAGAVDALSAEVSTLDGEVTAVSNAITALTSTVGGFAAEGKFRVETVATESGAQATIGMSAAASDGASTQTASLFLSATSSGTSRITVVADQFVITDGTNTQNPFLFTGGTAYLQNIKVQGADIENLTVDWADITNVSIEFADIENVNIASGMIAANAVTDNDDATGSTGPIQVPNTNWNDLVTISVSSDSGNPVLLYYNMNMTATAAGTFPAQGQMRVLRTQNSKVIATISASASSGSDSSQGDRLLLDPVPSSGTYQYRIQYRRQSAGGSYSFSGSLIAQCNRK